MNDAVLLDTSALIAFLEGEPAAERVASVLASASRLRICTATVVEAGIVTEEARRGELAGRELDLLFHRLGVEHVPVAEEHAELARSAHRRFGKGRHVAGLNFGDCFAYALAAALGARLLFVGDNFARTDVEPAWGADNAPSDTRRWAFSSMSAWIAAPYASSPDLGTEREELLEIAEIRVVGHVGSRSMGPAARPSRDIYR